MRVVVASTNLVKIAATRRGFTSVFPNVEIEVNSVTVESFVAAQPMSDRQTYIGASNRALVSRHTFPDADYWVGIEGGCEETYEGLQAFAWVYIVNAAGQVGLARTGSFYLPEEVARFVRSGMELGDADDLVFGRSNSKQQEGSIGLLTEGLITRTDYYANAVEMALIPFVQQSLTFGLTRAFEMVFDFDVSKYYNNGQAVLQPDAGKFDVFGRALIDIHKGDTLTIARVENDTGDVIKVLVTGVNMFRRELEIARANYGALLHLQTSSRLRIDDFRSAKYLNKP